MRARVFAAFMLAASSSGLRATRRRVVGAAPWVAPAALAPGVLANLVPLPTNAAQLEFRSLGDGLQVADVSAGRGDAVVARDSRVTLELVGRLVGKQGWTFEDTRDDDDPYRLQLGRGEVVEGLERGLLGMKVGAVRRVVVPSPLAYVDRSKEPVPRRPAFRQRLYGTVLNDMRRTQEQIGLGAGNDVAGVVAFDVKVLAIRPPR
mmetsp:Transcript_21481/g.64557  ORF Transcript_21481/g.64557 Transcript_21481/m.64557 type:complete len:205 (+) Transcript_21481:208-822(+)